MRSFAKYDAQQKFLNVPFRDSDPRVLQAAKYSNITGYMLELDNLYSTMFHEWPVLQKDTADVMDSVAGLDWAVSPYVEKGQKPSRKAQEVAEVVERALWLTQPQEPGTFAHDFLGLVGSLVDGIYRGHNVHEIIWGRAADGTIFPREFRQVPPQYYMWETRNGKDDRLLLVKDGESYSTPEPFPQFKFIIGLNTTGNDHPMWNGVYYSLLGYYGAARYGLSWMMDYCDRYGHPVRKFTVQSDEEEGELRAQLNAADNVTDVFLRPEHALEITPIQAGTGNPHKVLLSEAEAICHQVILGQTLTSDTSEGGGSRAQAEVHLGVQKAVVKKRAEYVCRVLNRQLVLAIVAKNYGSLDVPIPELKFSVPDDEESEEKAKYWGAVLQIPGMKVAKEVVYESLRIPMPGEDDAVFGGGDALPQGAEGAPQGKPGSKEQQNGTEDDDTPPDGGGKVDAAKAPAGKEPDLSTEDGRNAAADAMAAAAFGKYIAPTVRRLRAMVAAGVPQESILDRLPELMPDTEVLTDALLEAFTAGLGIDDAAVTAANPYGCNQYGEGWKKPHNGVSRQRKGESTADAKKDVDGGQEASDNGGAMPDTNKEEEKKNAELDSIIDRYNATLLPDGRLSVRPRWKPSAKELDDLKQKKEAIIDRLKQKEQQKKDAETKRQQQINSLEGKKELDKAKDEMNAADAVRARAENRLHRTGNENDRREYEKANAAYDAARQKYDEQKAKSPRAAAYDKYVDMQLSPNANTATIGKTAAEKILNGESPEAVDAWVKKEREKTFFRD